MQISLMQISAWAYGVIKVRVELCVKMYPYYSKSQIIYAIY